MIAGTIQFALSLPVLAEYRTVLLRDRIRERHCLVSGEVDRSPTRVGGIVRRAS